MVIPLINPIKFFPIYQNEQITVTSDNGLVEGEWTCKVQAKLLPYAAVQPYSLVITVNGHVTPPTDTVPQSVSPIILQKCYTGVYLFISF